MQHSSQTITRQDLEDFGLEVPHGAPLIVPWRDRDELFCAIAFEPAKAVSDYYALLRRARPLWSRTRPYISQRKRRALEGPLLVFTLPADAEIVWEFKDSEGFRVLLVSSPGGRTSRWVQDPATGFFLDWPAASEFFRPRSSPPAAE